MSTPAARAALLLITVALVGCGRNTVRPDAARDAAADGAAGGADGANSGSGGAIASGGAGGGGQTGDAGAGGATGGEGGATSGVGGAAGAAGGRGGQAGGAACASAVAQATCAGEGTTCSSGCTDMCQFCQLLRCQDGRWTPLEVAPAPCFLCGPSLRCQKNAQYCYAVMGGPVGATPSYQCRTTPTACLPAPTCACVKDQVGAPSAPSPTCQQGGAGELTVTFQAQ